VAEVREKHIIADTLDAIDGLELTGFGTGDDRQALQAVLREYVDVFNADTGIVPGWEFKIEVEDQADMSKLNRPVSRKSPMEQEVERCEMRKLLERGIVEPSKSPFGTANVFVPKKPLPDGTPGGLRVTADMRAVNSVTIGDAFPTEDIQAIVSWLAGKKWYSVVDLRDSYWKVNLAEGSRHFTAVKTVEGLIQCCRMTMGLKNAAAFFQCLVNRVYDELKGKSLQAYQDDLAVLEMLARTRKANFRLKFSKCVFGRREVEFLGHKVSHCRVEPNDHHRECLKGFKEPCNASELLRFLGLLQFFSGHIDRLAEMAAPLYNVLVGTAWNKPKKGRIKSAYLTGKLDGEMNRKNHSGDCGMCSPTRRFWSRRDPGPKKDFVRTPAIMGWALLCYNWRVKEKDGYRWDSLAER
jgi:hypothetical protein